MFKVVYSKNREETNRKPLVYRTTSCSAGELILLRHTKKCSSIWSSWRCPRSLQGGWARWPLKVPSHPKHSLILWLGGVSKGGETPVQYKS